MSGNRRRRYDEEPKLNYKKIFASIMCMAVVIMIIVSIVKIVQNNKNIQPSETMSYFTIYSNNKWGVIDHEGKIVIKPTYDEMIIIPNNEVPLFLCVYDVNDETGSYKTKVINEKGEETLKGYSRYEAIDNYDSKQNIWYEDNVLRTNKNGKYGLINFKGETLLECEYDEIIALKGVESNFLVKQEGKVGLVNDKGQWIVDINKTNYKDILILQDGHKDNYIVINEADQYGLISTSGKIVIEPQYQDIRYVNSSDAYVVKEDGKLKLINTSGSAIIAEGYDDILHYKADNAIVVKDGKYGIAHKVGNETIVPEYEELRYAFSTYYIAKKDNKYGIINLNNEEVLGYAYISMYYVENGGFFQADLSETETVILNNSFAETITGIVSEVNKEKGYIKVYTDNEHKYYNFKFEQRKSSDVLTANTLFLSKGANGKYGYVDKEGNIVIDYIYDDGTEQNKYGYAAVKKDGLWGSINRAGKIILEPKVNLDNSIYIDFIGEWHLSSTGIYYTK